MFNTKDINIEAKKRDEFAESVKKTFAEEQKHIKYVVRGIGDSWHVSAKVQGSTDIYGSAGLRIKVTEGQYNKVKEAIEKVINEEYKISGIRIIATYDPKGYVELSIRGYEWKKDKIVVERLNLFSNFVHEKIYGNSKDAPVVGEADHIVYANQLRT